MTIPATFNGSNNFMARNPQACAQATSLAANWRSSRRRILPAGVIGNSFMIARRSGALNFAVLRPNKKLLISSQLIFDFLATDLFAAAIDDVLQTALDEQIAVDPPYHVAHAVVAVVGERSAVFFRSIVVAANGIRAAADQLADRAIEDVVAALVDNADFIRRRYRPPGAGESNLGRIVEAGHVQQSFAGPEALLKRTAKLPLDPAAQFRRKLGATVHHHAQAGKIAMLRGIGVQPFDDQRNAGGDDRHALGLDQSRDGFDAGVRRDHRGAAV